MKTIKSQKSMRKQKDKFKNQSNEYLKKIRPILEGETELLCIQEYCVKNNISQSAMEEALINFHYTL